MPACRHLMWHSTIEGRTGLRTGRTMAKTATSTEAATEIVGRPGELSSAELISFYRLMYLSRKTDDREIVLKRQQKIFFQISCAGHEALLVAAGMAMRPGYDWFFPYYRDRALCLTLGNTVEDQLLQAVGAKEDPASGGRQMPSHWTSPKLNIVSPSSSTATQCLHASDARRRGCISADIRRRRPSTRGTTASSRMCASTLTRWCMSRSARDRRARESSGRRLTRRQTGGCRWCLWWKITSTRSRHRWR